jgi:hypothetical protein
MQLQTDSDAWMGLRLLDLESAGSSGAGLLLATICSGGGIRNALHTTYFIEISIQAGILFRGMAPLSC